MYAKSLVIINPAISSGNTHNHAKVAGPLGL